MHDFGLLSCVDSSKDTVSVHLIYYRQHGLNAVGASDETIDILNYKGIFTCPIFNYLTNYIT
jgi:hypothetical protein